MIDAMQRLLSLEEGHERQAQLKLAK